MYKLPEDIGNKYEFVTLASKRAEQLQVGARPRVLAPDRKVTVVAQAEVAQGAVTRWEPDTGEILDATDEEEE
jgi:DNA-directed RNA polymerase omega subunit